MKILKCIALCAVLLAVYGIIANLSLAQEPTTPPGMDEMMKKWMELGTPGEKHQLLERFVGEWEVATRSWMGGPDAPPIESKGTVSAKMILGGRFLMEEMAGDMMGKPFKGIGVTGYDNFKKRFVSLWMDDASTGMYYAEGGYNEAEQALIFYGSMNDPMTGEQDKGFKNVIRILDKNKHVFEMHELEKGEKSKVAEMIYTRKK